MFAGRTKKLAMAGQLRELTPAELTEVSGGWNHPQPPFQQCGFNHHHKHHHKHHHHRRHNFFGCGPYQPI
jgi:hypothetical protein